MNDWDNERQCQKCLRIGWPNICFVKEFEMCFFCYRRYVLFECELCGRAYNTEYAFIQQQIDPQNQNFCRKCFCEHKNIGFLYNKHTRNL